MSELHKFLFDGLPVRGMLVRLSDAWQEMLLRRAASSSGAFPEPVRRLLGEMSAAGVLMQSNIKFNGALILQVLGDGPVKLAVAEVQPNLQVRATAKVVGSVPHNAALSDMLNAHGKGRCAITLDPKDRLPGQQPYQGVVPLVGDDGENLQRLSEVLEHYMRQSEQLDTKIVLAANNEVAAGLLIQRLPIEGTANLGANSNDEIDANEAYNRIAHLAASLTAEELLTLPPETVLHRLFWEEPLLRYEPLTGDAGPKFACTCSRERVAHMLKGLGQDEVQDILAEQGRVDIGCDFCGAAYGFDAVDVGELFTPASDHLPGSGTVQ